MTNDLRIQLEHIFNKLQIEKRNTDLLIKYIQLLNNWNKNINLISKKEKNIVCSLVAPSLLFFKLFKTSISYNIVDLGSGAGFPSITIKIYNPNINITMVDSNAKKTAFLHYATTKLSLKCNIINKNFNSINYNELNNIDIVTVRGVNITNNILDIIKTKIQSKWLVYYTSPKNHLTLDLARETEIYSISAQLYKL